jgi:hypothetical protein
MQEIDGTIGRNFSDQYINLTKSFCCDTGDLKLIRWIGCKPGVYKGSKTLFSSDDLALCSWFQSIENYSYMTVELGPSSSVELELNKTAYIFGKTTWPSDALNSLKQLELGLNGQPGLVGSFIPFNIDYPNPARYNFTLIRDLFQVGTSSPFDGKMILNNVSPYDVSISFLYAY